MNPEANTRNVDTLRNVLADELVGTYARYLQQNQVPEVLHDVLAGDTPYHRLALRLQVPMPRGPRLVGRIVVRTYEASRSTTATG